MLNKKAKITLDAITFLRDQSLNQIFLGPINLELMDQVSGHLKDIMLMFARYDINSSCNTVRPFFDNARANRKQWLAIFEGCQFVNGELVA